MKRPRYDQDYYERPVQKKRRYYTPKKRFVNAPVRQYVPRTLGPLAVSESKYFDSYLSSATISEQNNWQSSELDPTTLNTLFCPTEGSDIDNRIGRKVSLYKLALRGVIRGSYAVGQANILTSPAFRIILYQDMQTNGVQSQGEELMAAPGTANTSLAFSTFQNLSNLGRFKVLKDLVLRPRIVTAAVDTSNSGTGVNTSTQGYSDIIFKIVVKFKKPVVVKFNATNGGTIGDIVDNSFHLIGIKSNSAFGDQLGTMNYQCRGYYKDQ